MTRRPTTPTMESRDSLSDDEFENPSLVTPMLVYEDHQLRDGTLQRLNTLRKGGHFCDVTIQIGNQSVAAHRVLLASSSVFFYEAFSDEDHQGQQHLKLKYPDYASFNILMDYIYTARLEVPADKVKSVYKAAIMLKMERAAEACAHFLVEHLTPEACLGIRSFANSYSDRNLTSKTDDYICNNVDSILSSQELFKFPQLQVKVVGVSDLQEFEEIQLCHLVVDYLRAELDDGEDTSISVLMDTPKMLYLQSGSHLIDCMDVTDPTIGHSDLVTDYRQTTKFHKQPNTAKDMRRSNSAMNGVHQAIGDKGSVDKEWHIIATKLVSAQRCTAITMLNDQLCTLSIKFYPEPQRPSSPEEIVEPEGGRPCSPGESTVAVTPLGRMGTARCGMGAAVVNGKLITLGGYDRGECLDSVELYDFEANTWTDLPPMLTARGRFDASQINGKVYACGGCNGSKELKSVECFDPELKQWTNIPDMATNRSSAGVTVLDNKLFVIGGWSGFTGLKSCEMFDPETGTWSSIASLNTGRSQSAVCTFQGKLVAIGGCDAWNSTNSVEVYDPEKNKWSFLTPMATNRRGAGAVAHNDKLYVLGGSDGQSSLTSVEIYDSHTQTWTSGPPLTSPRANVAVTVLDGRVFAVGGFSGKKFLDTVEYLCEDAGEWTYFLPSGHHGNGHSNGHHSNGHSSNGCLSNGDVGGINGDAFMNGYHGDSKSGSGDVNGDMNGCHGDFNANSCTSPVKKGKRGISVEEPGKGD